MKRVILLLTLFLIIGCSSNQSKQKPDAEVCNTIYHWKTTFNLNNEELNFLERHSIKKIYLRLFDVTPALTYADKQYCSVIPTATTIFNSPIPKDVQIAPTIYITLEALRKIEGRESKVAELIIKRVMAMVKGNNLGVIKEVQIDCDWTSTTQSSYFKLCQKIGNILNPKGIALSSTIRLHQLRGKMPPVDRGTLMLYNTGPVKLFSTRNSILDYNIVKIYLKNLGEIKLPLDFAYPTFSWGVRFYDYNFRSLIKSINLNNSFLYENIYRGNYKVLRSHNVGDIQIDKGEIIRFESSPFNEIVKVKKLVEESIKQDNYSSIIYHLDSSNLKKYSDNEINTIYNNKYFTAE